MFRFTGRVLRGTAIAAAVVCAYGAGVVSGGGGGEQPGPASRSLLDEAATKIGQEAVEPVDHGELDRAAIDGMLKRLGDKWARYYSAEEFDDFQGRLNGSYSGVGIWLGTGTPARGDSGGDRGGGSDAQARVDAQTRAEDSGGPKGSSKTDTSNDAAASNGATGSGGAAASNGAADSGGATGSNGATGSGGRDRARTASNAPVRVASVQPGSAAAKAGVRSGDVITQVDGERVDGWDVTRVAAALRGKADTGVRLTVVRDGREQRFTLVRTQVQSGDVSVSALQPDVQLVRVGAFTRGVGRQVRDAVAGAPDRHRGGILLDLRGNPGGLLDEAVETASAFLPGGLVVTYERQGRPAERMNVTHPGDADTPLVVLVDAGTASAAEVVAGSLRDRDRAVIVGSRTYGKGSVQEPIRLEDGSAIELTVGRYRTPNGRNLDGVGIDPDVAVSADRPPGEVEQRGRTVLRGLIATLPEVGSGGAMDRDRG
jgi:carboxyl-terminal processing protease